jgi:ethanolamine utilization protein EutN
MKLGRVIGRVVCTQKMECFDGLKLLLVQPVDENGKDAGSALVAFDIARAGEGDLVMFEAGKEAAKANPNGWFNPGDAAILGVVDAVNVAEGTATAVNVAEGTAPAVNVAAHGAPARARRTR